MLQLQSQIMRAYHGTPKLIPHDDIQHGRLFPSPWGSFGSGIYLGDLNVAVEYGQLGEVYGFDVNHAKFLRVDACFDSAEPFDLDTAALPLLETLFDINRADAARLFLSFCNHDGLLGREIEVKAHQRGYQGLLLDYGDCFEIVVYDTTALVFRESFTPA